MYSIRRIDPIMPDYQFGYRFDIVFDSVIIGATRNVENAELIVQSLNNNVVELSSLRAGNHFKINNTLFVVVQDQSGCSEDQIKVVNLTTGAVVVLSCSLKVLHITSK